MSLTTDAECDELLRRARAGDTTARGVLLERRRSYLTLLARVQIGQRLQGKVDAADLVQETFLEAHRGFDRFRGGSELELISWLRSILAANLAHLVRRFFGAQRRDMTLERQLEVELDRSSRCLHEGLLAKQSSPSQGAVRREQAELLADAVENLPADHREVILLRNVVGLTFPEIAGRMDRSVDSVEKLWIRGLDRLRRSLKGAQ